MVFYEDYRKLENIKKLQQKVLWLTLEAKEMSHKEWETRVFCMHKENWDLRSEIP